VIPYGFVYGLLRGLASNLANKHQIDPSVANCA